MIVAPGISLDFINFLISFITDITNRTDILTALTKDLRSGNHVELGHKVSFGYIYCFYLVLWLFLLFFAFAFYVARVQVFYSFARSADYGLIWMNLDGMSWAGAGFWSSNCLFEMICFAPSVICHPDSICHSALVDHLLMPNSHFHLSPSSVVWNFLDTNETGAILFSNNGSNSSASVIRQSANRQ